LGEPAYLAEELGVPVVGNFRAGGPRGGRRRRAAGDGFPSAGFFGQRGEHVCVNNLGGISNVTSLDWRQEQGGAAKVLAFDTGPANVLMDIAVRHFTGGRKSCDHDGGWAARGTADETLLRKWLRHPYFQGPPPKSTGRELFGEAFFQKLPAGLRSEGLQNTMCWPR